MNVAPKNDADWLSHDSSAPQPCDAAPDVRVYRDDGEPLIAEYRSLTVALTEPPASPESVIRDASQRCLAMAHPDGGCDACDDEGRCARGPWVVTTAGHVRLAEERSAA